MIFLASGNYARRPKPGPLQPTLGRPVSFNLDFARSVASRLRPDVMLNLGKRKACSVNCLVLGGPGSGKTSLLYSYNSGTFPNTPPPTELLVERSLRLRSRTLHLRLLDLGPVSRVLDLAPGMLANIDLILLCYNIADRGSMDTAVNVLSYIELHSEDCSCCEASFSTKFNIPKLVVVGNKCDLRHNQETIFEMFDSERTLVSPAEGRRFAEGLRADLYHETSALFHEGVDELFQEIHSMLFPSVRQRLFRLSNEMPFRPFVVL